ARFSSSSLKTGSILACQSASTAGVEMRSLTGSAASAGPATSADERARPRTSRRLSENAMVTILPDNDLFERPSGRDRPHIAEAAECLQTKNNQLTCQPRKRTADGPAWRLRPARGLAGG